MPDDDSAAELARAKMEIDALSQRVSLLERKVQDIPFTYLLSPSFLTRAFAVVGLQMVGSLILGILLAFYFILSHRW